MRIEILFSCFMGGSNVSTKTIQCDICKKMLVDCSCDIPEFSLPGKRKEIVDGKPVWKELVRNCGCEKWEDGVKAVNGPITLQSVRSGGAYEFDQDYVFLFCPWCGLRLNAPCANCGEPSNKNNKNTIYWQEDENYCTVECGVKVMEGGN